jgi:hypothetical protein
VRFAIAGLVALFLLFLHVLLFRILDDFLGVPLTIGVFVLVYAVFFLIVYWEEILGRPSRRGGQAPLEVPAGLMTSGQFAELTEPCLKADDPAFVRTVELLREARDYLYGPLGDCLAEDSPCRIVREDFGTASVRPALNAGRTFLYLRECPSDDPAGVETLACIWKLQTEPDIVLLTIDAERNPQLLLEPGHHRYPATPAGWRDLVDHLVVQD